MIKTVKNNFNFSLVYVWIRCEVVEVEVVEVRLVRNGSRMDNG